MTNKNDGVLYTGVTSNLFKRVSEHKNKIVTGFTSKYNLTKLVYYEEYATMEEDMAREKQIKGGSRQKKIDLINSKILSGKIYMRNFLPKHSYFFVIAKEPFRRLKQSHTQYMRLLRREEHPPRNDGNEIKI